MAKCLKTVMWDTSRPNWHNFLAKVLIGIEVSLWILYLREFENLPVIFFGRPLPFLRLTVLPLFNFLILSYIVERGMFVTLWISVPLRIPLFHNCKMVCRCLSCFNTIILQRSSSEKQINIYPTKGRNLLVWSSHRSSLLDFQIGHKLVEWD